MLSSIKIISLPWHKNSIAKENIRGHHMVIPNLMASDILSMFCPLWIFLCNGCHGKAAQSNPHCGAIYCVISLSPAAFTKQTLNRTVMWSNHITKHRGQGPTTIYMGSALGKVQHEDKQAQFFIRGHSSHNTQRQWNAIWPNNKVLLMILWQGLGLVSFIYFTL